MFDTGHQLTKQSESYPDSVMHVVGYLRPVFVPLDLRVRDSRHRTRKACMRPIKHGLVLQPDREVWRSLEPILRHRGLIQSRRVGLKPLVAGLGDRLDSNP